MTGLVFVDTNVLIYARDPADAAKLIRARDWLDAVWADRNGRTSFQVLHEFYATALRRFPGTTIINSARHDIRQLLEWDPVRPSAALLEEAWALQDRFGISWWDSLIVAAAQESGCRYLLSEDFQHGQAFGRVQVVNPFRATPEELP